MKKFCYVLCVILGQCLLMQTAVAQAVVKVATDAVYPPFEYLDEKNNILGIEADLLREIAQKQGFEVEISHHPRAKWAQTLASGEVDLWASAFYQGNQWSEQADMSDPFMEAYITLVVMQNDKNQDINSIEDFQGKKIAVSKYYGQAMVDLAVSLTGSADNVVVLDTFYLSMREMFSGKADAVLGANYVQAYYIKQVQEKKGIQARFFNIPNQEARQLVFLLKKGNTQLLDKINKGIARAKADGTIAKLQAQWLSAWQTVK